MLAKLKGATHRDSRRNGGQRNEDAAARTEAPAPYKNADDESLAPRPDANAIRVISDRLTSRTGSGTTRYEMPFYASRSPWGGAIRARTGKNAYGLGGSGRAKARERHIKRLPAPASEIYGFSDLFGWGSILSTLLLGTRDDGSPLSVLRGLEDQLVRRIRSYLAPEFANHVILTLPAVCVAQMQDRRICRYTKGRPERRNTYEPIDGLPPMSESDMLQGCVAFSPCGNIEFPEPAGRKVNMMPFILGDKSSLPEDLRCYHDRAIERCPYGDGDIGKVAYLTVHESYVEPGSAQRREGLHIETPGIIAADNNPAFCPGVEHRWGMGIFFAPDRYEGGIYMASSVAKTSKVWDALVDKNVKGIVDKHGGCEHLRRIFGKGTKLRANELIWMTDCTPHEALPQKRAGHRQFFRLVTPNISHWFADHCTSNPKVPLPGDVIIVRGNKFQDG